MTGVCFECEAEGEVHEHHVVPYSLEGTKTVFLCLVCHGKVHDMNFASLSKKTKGNGRKKRRGSSILQRIMTPELAALIQEEQKKSRLEGIAKAKSEGRFKGRHKDTKEDAERFLNKEKTKVILKTLSEGLTILETAQRLGVSTTTVVKARRKQNEYLFGFHENWKRG